MPEHDDQLKALRAHLAEISRIRLLAQARRRGQQRQAEVQALRADERAAAGTGPFAQLPARGLSGIR